MARFKFCCYTQRYVSTAAVFVMHGRTPCDSVGKKEKKRKKEHIAEGKEERKKKTFSPRRSQTLACNVNAFVSWCANVRAISIHSLSISFSLIGTSIALSHASQQMHLIKHILFFMYKRETALLLK